MKMEKYRIYVNSGYINVSTQAAALKKAKEMLDMGINVDIKVEEVIKKED